MAYSNDDKIDYLLGQVAVLTAFSQALLITHHNDAALLQVFAEQRIKFEADSLYKPIREAYHDGAQSVLVLLQPQNPTVQE